MVGGGGTVLVTSSLSIPSGGKLDLADDAMIVDYSGSSPCATIRSYLVNGRNSTAMSGAWDGNGICSSVAALDGVSYALGYAENSAIMVPGPYKKITAETVVSALTNI